jgi:polysaccharide deacetylase 2 family uncharacterized protein YibQ
MGLRGKRFFSPALIWRLSMWGAALLVIAMASLLVVAGLSDTRDAAQTGRRLVISLETGAISGKKNTLEPAPKEEAPATAKPDEPPPAGPSPDPLPAPASEPPPPPADAPAPEASAPAPAAESVPEPVPAEPPAASPEPAAAPAPEASIKPGEEMPLSLPLEEQQQPEEALTIVPAAKPLPDVNTKLVEKTDQGPVPIIGGDGSKAWQYYSKPFSRSGNEPMVTIIITGLGQSKPVTERALLLPDTFTLSFSPYAKGVADWANTARLTAHEKMLDLPLQAPDFPASDPGPYGLLLDKGAQENENRLRWVLSRATGYIGVLTPYNENYTANAEAFKMLMQSLANRGLALGMAAEPPRSEIKELLAASSTPNITADMLVDEELLDTAIDTRLSALEQLARKRGYAVGLAQATPLTMERLKQWSAGLESRGVRLVPASTIIRLRFS